MLTGGHVTDAVYDRVRGHFSERELADPDVGGSGDQCLESAIDFGEACSRNVSAGDTRELIVAQAVGARATSSETR